MRYYNSYKMVKRMCEPYLLADDELTMVYEAIREIASYKTVNGYIEKLDYSDICKMVWCANWDGFSDDIEDKAISIIADLYRNADKLRSMF